jgi:surface carbohydrate biosynthesis protein
MAGLTKKISRLFCKLKFASPEKNDIVILHHNTYWIKKFVLRDIKSTSLENTDLGRIYFVTPALIFKTLFRLHLVDWSVRGETWSFRSLLGRIFRIYILACIEETQAKVVITFIDNSRVAQSLSRIDPKRTYFFVQNGTRTLACVRDTLPHPASIITMTNFFCFGQRDIDLLTKHGHRVDNYFSIGSLGTGCYQSHVLADPSIDFDLCLISQWDKSFLEENLNEKPVGSISYRIGVGITGVNSFLSRLVGEIGLKLVICLRNENNEEEVTYFKDMFGNKPFISEHNYKSFAAYQMIDRSRLTVALNSTLLSEAFSRGKKVLWCNVPKDEHYEMPEAGISYFDGNDYAAFKERVLILLKMPQDEYEETTRERKRYINNYNPLSPPHEVIRTAVIKVLSNS